MGGLKCALKDSGIFSTEFTHMYYAITPADRKRIAAALKRETRVHSP